MGCCISQPSSPTTPSDNPTTATSALPHNTLASTALSTVHHPVNPTLKPLPADLDIPRPTTTQHYEPGSSSFPPLTPNELARQRAAYFETAVHLGGRSEIWAALATVCELYREGRLEEASAILGAMGCSLPSGELWGRRAEGGGVWDEWGSWYEIPVWCLGTPEGVGSADEERDEEEVEAVRRSRAKAKGKAAVGGKRIRVRARLSHVARDVVVSIDDEDTVGTLIERLREKASLAEDAMIKISYLGTILHEDKSLSAQGWAEGQVISAYVFLDSAEP